MFDQWQIFMSISCTRTKVHFHIRHKCSRIQMFSSVLNPTKSFFIDIWNQPAKQASGFLFVLFRCVKHGVIVNNKDMLPASACSRRFALYVGGFIVVHLLYKCHTFQALSVAVACFCQRTVFSSINNQTTLVAFPLIYGHMVLQGRL